MLPISFWKMRFNYCMRRAWLELPVSAEEAEQFLTGLLIMELSAAAVLGLAVRMEAVAEWTPE